MDGGHTRDFVLLRTALAIACAALMALIAAPGALAGSPATDQYGSAIPGGGSGGNTSGSGSGGGSQTTIPVAPDSSSSGQAAGASSDTSGTDASSAGAGSKGGSSHGARQGNAHNANSHRTAGTDSGNSGSVSTQNAAGHSVPQIAADSAGDSWLPFFVGGMIALACAAAALVFFRNRRRTA